MYVAFDKLPDTSRVWIYQSNRILSAEEKSLFSNQLKRFCNEWTAHSQELHASFDIAHDSFIILAVDESATNATGCSIDKSVNQIQELENTYNLGLLNRDLLAFMIENEIVYIPLTELKNYIKDKKINNQSTFFNNLASTKNELNSLWKVRAEQSWLKKYF